MWSVFYPKYLDILISYHACPYAVDSRYPELDLGLSRIIAYLEMKIWSLFKN